MRKNLIKFHLKSKTSEYLPNKNFSKKVNEVMIGTRATTVVTDSFVVKDNNSSSFERK